ncbi:hypothetical protein EDD15DRAFT_1752840 [Pisolithus albus]|nr:hypothetical protein EDD15DRAFT_1752840 [Pisolithus albus]
MLIPITKHDERKARKMLCRPPENMPVEWRHALMHILKIRRKAEIEILSNARKTSTVTEHDSLSLESYLSQSVLSDPSSGNSARGVADPSSEVVIGMYQCRRPASKVEYLNEDRSKKDRNTTPLWPGGKKGGFDPTIKRPQRTNGENCCLC